MKKIRVIVLRTAGTNCDQETAFAFGLAGGSPELVHINELTSRRRQLGDYHILAIPGGFTYGDDIASGKILANELKFKIKVDIERFIDDGKLVIGICNGFQILVKAGFLPNLSGRFEAQEATLTLNDSGRFEDRWVYLRKSKILNPKSKNSCVWTYGMPEVIYLPVAHGEGKFVPRDKETLKRLESRGLVVFRYCDENGAGPAYPMNPNGSVNDIAGICDPSGRIFALMPHPERHIFRTQHPRWTRHQGHEGLGDGFSIFRNGVEYARKRL